jgi:hypothetical protein
MVNGEMDDGKTSKKRLTANNLVGEEKYAMK